MNQQTNPDFISRPELEQIVESRLNGTLIQDADLAKKVASSGMIIKTLRAEFGWTQQYLADISGVHVSAISQYEKGLRNPTFETINRLCDAFDVTSDYLMGRQPKSFDDILQDENTLFILRKMLHFNPVQRSVVLEHIKFTEYQNIKMVEEVENN